MKPVEATKRSYCNAVKIAIHDSVRGQLSTDVRLTTLTTLTTGLVVHVIVVRLWLFVMAARHVLADVLFAE